MKESPKDRICKVIKAYKISDSDKAKLQEAIYDLVNIAYSEGYNNGKYDHMNIFK